jgi:hypothetical protein
MGRLEAVVVEPHLVETILVLAAPMVKEQETAIQNIWALFASKYIIYSLPLVVMNF